MTTNMTPSQQLVEETIPFSDEERYVNGVIQDADGLENDLKRCVAYMKAHHARARENRGQLSVEHIQAAKLWVKMWYMYMRYIVGLPVHDISNKHLEAEKVSFALGVSE